MGGACLGRMTFDGGGHVQAAQRDTDFDGVNWFQAEWLMGVSGFRRNGPPSLPEMLGATVFRRQCNFRNMRQPHENDIEQNGIMCPECGNLMKMTSKKGHHVLGMRQLYENDVQKHQNSVRSATAS